MLTLGKCGAGNNRFIVKLLPPNNLPVILKWNRERGKNA